MKMEANLVPEIRPSKVEIQSWTCEDPPKAYGLESDIRSLEALIRQRENQNQFKAIGIAGSLGVGKTTLCQQLLSRSEWKIHFLPIIWVCMSREPTEEEGNDTKINKFRKDENQRKITLLKRMLSNLGVDDEDNQITASIPEDNVQEKLKAMLYVLHLQLKGKRYMIVLDDARETNEWYNDLGCFWSVGSQEKWGHRLAHGLPKGSGGTVIVTSRIEEIAKMMVREERNIHRFLPHSDPESFWLIFIDSCKKIGSENNEAEEYEKKFDNGDQETMRFIKQRHMKRCGGLPLVANFMALKSEYREQISKEVEQIDHKLRQLGHTKSEPIQIFEAEQSHSRETQIDHLNSDPAAFLTHAPSS